MEYSIIFELGITIFYFWEHFINTYLYHSMMTSKYTFKKTAAISCSLLFLCTIIGSFDFSNNMLFRQILYITVYLFLGRTLYRDSYKKILFSFATIHIIMFALDWFISILFYKILETDQIGFPQGSVRFIANLMFEILHTPIVLTFGFFGNRIRKNILPKSIHLIFLFPISQFFLCEIAAFYVQLEILQHRFYTFPIVCTFMGYLLSIVASLIMFQVILSNSQKERLAVQLDIMKQHACRELEYCRSVNDKVLQMRKICHDFNNQLQTAYGLFLQGTKESQKEAYSFLSQLENHIESQMLPVCYCQNMIVNVILEEKAKKAKAANLAFSADVALPDDLSIDMVDVCSVFSNLLDFSINSGSTSIKVVSYLRSGYCIVQVIHSIAPSAHNSANLPSSVSKKDSELHGHGSPILHAITEKYHGDFRTNIEHGNFSAKIKLMLPSCDSHV